MTTPRAGWCANGKDRCRIPKAHKHVPDSTSFEMTEWWCPSGESWVVCPGPCPDGREHGAERTVTYKSNERIELL